MANITERKHTDGTVSYLIRVYIDENGTGKQSTKSMTWHPKPGMRPSAIQKELHRQADLFEDKAKKGLAGFGGSMHFEDYANTWVNNAPLSYKTRNRYKELLIRINEAIGHIRLDKLQAHHLEEFYRNLAEEGINKSDCYAISDNLNEIMKKRKLSRADLGKQAGIAAITVSAAARGQHIRPNKAEQICKALDLPLKTVFKVHESQKALSDKTIYHHHKLICTILAKAKRERIIPYNVASEQASAPKVQHKEARYMDDKQAKKFVNLLVNEPDIRVKTSLLLLLFSGVRRGELFGLTWPDIDFEKQLINVLRSSQYQKGKGMVDKETKTESSIRSIKVPAIIIDVLKQYHAWWNQKRLIYGQEWQGKTEHLFIQDNGKPLNSETVNFWLDRFLKENDLPHYSPHNLRHTFATLQITNGVDIRTLQSRTGHAQASTLVNIYSHAIESAQEAASETLERVLLPNEEIKEDSSKK